MYESVGKGIIFVGGVHGVGKTTLCSKIAKKYNINYYSSSNLISKLSDEKLRSDKLVKNINKNQDILIEATNRYITDDKSCLLDGHFCLINDKKNIEKVPISTFKRLKIKKIIIVTDKALNIVNRLYKRDNKKYSIDFINKFQIQEIEYAKYVSKVLDVLYEQISLDDKKMV
ncbi:adenylate kinase [Clostridium sp. DSM 8431]|uniref:ATP-binding protein n=1 Tax=Clostridium sp. DSM 8431 TaxID=1761781 RepID=UPI0008EA9A4E|nr:ATP-binding protein [Clostridium sp. DSM 8431]SFU78368.1 adenylate kinase [Clostridium sp. DSM 8431]